MDWFDGANGGTPLDVPAMLDSDAGGLLHEIVGSGALVSLGLTSDGGALGVTITVDGRWRREYFRDHEALSDWLAEGAPAIREAVLAARAAHASSGSRRRTRGL